MYQYTSWCLSTVRTFVDTYSTRYLANGEGGKNETFLRLPVTLRRAKPKSPVIHPARAATPRKEKKGLQYTFFKQTGKCVDHFTHANKKNLFVENERPWTSFHLLFFFTASFRLIFFYRILWLVVVDLVVSRIRLWFIVAFAPAFFVWPWHLFHFLHILLGT
jgi:hypothetical protein